MRLKTCAASIKTNKILWPLHFREMTSHPELVRKNKFVMWPLLSDFISKFVWNVIRTTNNSMPWTPTATTITTIAWTTILTWTAISAVSKPTE